LHNAKIGNFPIDIQFGANKGYFPIRDKSRSERLSTA
jgi:hypothetical protein